MEKNHWFEEVRKTLGHLMDEAVKNAQVKAVI